MTAVLHPRAAESRADAVPATGCGSHDTATPARRGVVRTGLAAVAVAAVATTAVAAAGRAAGISLVLGGGPVPVRGFAVLTVVFGVVGVVLAAALRRWAREPRRTFVRVTAVLTVLSVVPDLVAGAGAATVALFVATHLVAAAIVVPVLARRLPA